MVPSKYPKVISFLVYAKLWISVFMCVYGLASRPACSGYTVYFCVSRTRSILEHTSAPGIYHDQDKAVIESVCALIGIQKLTDLFLFYLEMFDFICFST